MVSKTIIGSSVTLWVLPRPGIKEWQRSKIHRRGPHPLEPGRKQTLGGHVLVVNGEPMAAIAHGRKRGLRTRGGAAEPDQGSDRPFGTFLVLLRRPDPALPHVRLRHRRK